MGLLELLRRLDPRRKLRLQLEKLRSLVDALAAERDLYLQQRDVAVGERNEILRQRDVALGERNELQRQRDAALAGGDKLYLDPERLQADRTASHHPRFFIVTSEGRTASFWLAAALHAHTDIVCGHSKQRPPIPNYSEQEQVTPELLKRVYDDLSRLPVAIDEYYDIVEQAGAAKVYGTVHAFSVREAHQRTSQMRRRYVLAHLTRHPVSRISSLYHLQRKTLRMSKPVLEHVTRGLDRSLQFLKDTGAQDIVEGIIGTRPVEDATGEIDWLAFASACLDVSAEASHLSQVRYVFPCERLTSDPNYFVWAFGILTGGSLVPDAGYIDRVFSTGRLNPSDRPQPNNALAIYAGWLPWQKKLLSLTNRWTNLPGVFFPHRYDLTFVTEEQ
jgi:hypothetical protein